MVHKTCFRSKVFVNYTVWQLISKWLELSVLTNRWNFENLHDCLFVCVFIYFNQLFQKQHCSSFSVILTLQLYTTFKNLFDGFGAKFWMISSPKFPQYIKGSSGWYTWFLRVMCWEVVLRHFEHSEKSVSLDTNAALGSLCLKW